MPRSTTSKPAPSSIIADQVLPDVVDVALHGADHDRAHPLGAGLGQQRAKDLHPGLHRVRGQQHLGDEQDAVAEVDADDPHPLDEGLVQHPVGAPTRARAGCSCPRRSRRRARRRGRRASASRARRRAAPTGSISSSLMSLSPFSRSPLGSHSGSALTVAASRSPKYSTSTAVPSAASVRRQVAVDDAAADRVAVRRARHVRHHAGRRAGSAPCPSRRRAGRRASCSASRSPGRRFADRLQRRPALEVLVPCRTANPRPASNGSCSVWMSWPQSR